MKIQIPEKLHSLFTNTKRYVVIFGGRGSGKSHGVAAFLLAKSLEKKCRILCTREIQNSIRDSVWKLLTEKIYEYKWDNYFKITENSIVCIRTGSEFIFKGLRGNAQDIKSTEGIDYCWVEEAQTVSRKSLEVLIPTIRKDGSQIIFTYNPLTEEDPIHADFTLVDRDDTLKIQINWRDNPWFPEVLRSDLDYDKKTNINKYLHIWEGHCVAYENDQIGAFQLVPEWKCQYAVAFIDPSFSDRTGTDSTAVAIAGVHDDLIIFTGMLWPKSISNPDVRRELLGFLNIYTPIETVFESQLSDSAVFFLDVLKREECIYNIKNLWSVKHQSKGKHERIMSTVGVQKGNMRMLEGTQQAFSLEVSRYRKDIDHDDAPDALAGAIEALGTSDIVAEYAKAVEIMRRR
jgi:hypothetical protein